MIGLAILFFATALLYASVGFGGGSTYNALLVLSGADYRILPAIALCCNIIVVAGGVWRFHASGHIEFRSLTPFVLFSVPLAWFGGVIPIKESTFVAILGVSLLVAGVQMLLPGRAPIAEPQRKVSWPLANVIGGGLGFLSGLVGIGGGIFLAPILYLICWGNPRTIAGACSFFILVNSLSGLAGQLTKLTDLGLLNAAADYWIIFPAVLIGGQIGSRLGAGPVSETWLKRITAVLVLYVALRLLWRWRGLIFG